MSVFRLGRASLSRRKACVCSGSLPVIISRVLSERGSSGTWHWRQCGVRLCMTLPGCTEDVGFYRLCDGELIWVPNKEYHEGGLFKMIIPSVEQAVRI